MAKTKVKPKKPTKDFPLFPHSNGQWCKVIKAKNRYFGMWNDPDAALRRYLDEKDYYLAGLAPPSKSVISVGELCNWYLMNQELKMNSGEIGGIHYNSCMSIAKVIIEFFGRETPIDLLTPLRMSEFRLHLSKGRKQKSLDSYVRRARAVFNYAENAAKSAKCEVHKIEIDELSAPTKSNLRKERNQKEKKFYDKAELLLLVGKARQPIKSMILLAANAGLGNTDLSNLKRSHIDFINGFLQYDRPKTGVTRFAVLWKETLDALKEIPRNKTEYMFLTKWNQPYVRVSQEGKPVDSISTEFNKLLVRCGLKRKGIGFYGIRHTYQSIARRTGLEYIVKRTMGHETGDMSDEYQEWDKSDEEIALFRQVSEYVRTWLFGESK